MSGKVRRRRVWLMTKNDKPVRVFFSRFIARTECQCNGGDYNGYRVERATLEFETHPKGQTPMTHPSSPPAPMTAGRLDQCAWLIECRIGPESTYIQLKSREELSQEWEEEIHARGYDAAKKLKPWHFTKDASSATRFAREEDAARAMVALGMQGPTGLLDWLRPTEHMWSDAAHPDVSNVPALTARVAELEGHVDDMSMKLTEAQHRCEAAEAELAAARKVEDGEVEKRLKSLAAMHHHLGYSHTLDHVDRESIKKAMDLLTRLSAALKEAERNKDGAYLERNNLVAFLARQFPSGVAKTAIDGWSTDWHGCVYIDTPAGQMSWHYHDSQAHLFDGLPPYQGQWDGHTTEQKYDRLRALQTKDTTP